MGREQKRISLYVHLRRHNDEGDIIDNRLYEELVRRIKLLAAEPAYEHLMVDVDTDM